MSEYLDLAKQHYTDAELTTEDNVRECLIFASVAAQIASATALTRLAEVAETLLTAGALDRIATIVDLLTDKSTDRAWLRIDTGA